ncbi:MAG: ATP-binding protein, partial [Bacilli bacterium]|nr:ATP-binding protein [Bacilli bacterium]
VQGIGYVRKFRECFLIDNSGNFTESVLLTEYVSSFIKDEYDNFEPTKGVYYNLDTLEKALNFTLISEGWLRNDQTYGDSVTLKVRLHTLIVGNNSKYFDVPDYISLESYLSSLLINNGKKYQIVNINLSDIDDDFAKVLTKIYSRLIFDFAKGLKQRGSIPFHIILEEAHRYIQDDRDRFLFGYNIFERIAKEGRKYGVIMGLISQRPVELSDTVISQCTNILIFKINHPVDVEYIRKMVPNITDEIIEKQKSLQPGTCLGFGLGFKIPIIVKMEMPNPSPLSSNCDVVRIWNGSGNGVPAPQPQPQVMAPAPVSIPDYTATVSMPAVSTVPAAPAVPAAALPDDSVQNLMHTMTQKPNLIDIVENVEAPADPTVSQTAVVSTSTPIVNNQQVVEIQSTPVTIPADSVAMPSQPMVLSDDSENANFAGVPDMGGFDMNGMAVNQQVVATSNVAANAAQVGLINLTNETI